MGEYGRMVFDFLVIITGPSFAPHFEVLALAFVVLAVAVVVALDHALVARVAIAPVVVVARVARRTVGRSARLVRTPKRARAPSLLGEPFRV